MTEYISKELVKSTLGDACVECIDMCVEFDGIYPDCNQCLLHGKVIEKIISIPAADVVPGEDFRDCLNELCLKCGSYQYDYKTHECDGCRWRH